MDHPAQPWTLLGLVRLLLSFFFSGNVESTVLRSARAARRKYRADTLLALQSSMTNELDLLDQLVKYHLKSYQVWCV